MPLLVIKLILTPTLITLVTLAGRRWGPSVSGWLVGFPLTSGPVSLILALQNGAPFAAKAAAGMIGGQGAVCVYCVAYALFVSRFSWQVSAALALGVFFLAALVLNQFTLTLLPVFLVVVAIILLGLRLVKPVRRPLVSIVPPWWDVPMRMLLAALFVLALTSASTAVGPQVSGLLSPFPIFGVILTSFAHRQQGSDAAHKLLRSTIQSALAFISFFLVAGALLPVLSLGWAYSLATLTTLTVNFISLLWMRREV